MQSCKFKVALAMRPISANVSLYRMENLIFRHEFIDPRRFTVAEWLTHSFARLEVTGSRPTFGGVSEQPISNLYSLRHGGTQYTEGIYTVSGTEGLKMVCVALHENCDL